jgi:hypothetical protein
MPVTPENPSALPLAPLPDGRFSGPREFADMIRLAFATAAHQGWREIILSDAGFEDWPLGERAVSESLNAWSKTGRKMTILARNYDELLRRHARFVTWRRTWAHIIECRANPSISADSFPSALWSPAWVFQRLDLAHCTGVAGPEVARRVHLGEQLHECLLKSSAAFPATTLGI